MISVVPEGKEENPASDSNAPDPFSGQTVLVMEEHLAAHREREEPACEQTRPWGLSGEEL